MAVVSPSRRNWGLVVGFIVLTLLLYPTLSFSQSRFSDLPSTHWAYYYVESAYNDGLITGYPDGTFKPDKNVTNAETVTLIARALKRLDEIYGEHMIEIPPQGSIEKNPYPDVPTDAWYAPYVEALKNIGLNLAQPDGEFHPNWIMRRGFFVYLLISALGIKPSSCDTSPFKDIPVDKWDCPYIKTAALFGYVNGFPDGTFRDEDPLTRAQITKVIYLLAGGKPLKSVKLDVKTQYAAQFYENVENWCNSIGKSTPISPASDNVTGEFNYSIEIDKLLVNASENTLSSIYTNWPDNASELKIWVHFGDSGYAETFINENKSFLKETAAGSYQLPIGAILPIMLKSNGMSSSQIGTFVYFYRALFDGKKLDKTVPVTLSNFDNETLNMKVVYTLETALKNGFDKLDITQKKNLCEMLYSLSERSLTSTPSYIIQTKCDPYVNPTPSTTPTSNTNNSSSGGSNLLLD